jgi:nitrogen fixation NifU-like protein
MIESLYQELILDHYRNPVGRGLREPFEAQVNHVNPTCGDEITLRVHLDGGCVADVSYDSQGCSISQASASMLHELVTGAGIAQSEAIGDAFLALMQSATSPTVPDLDLLGDALAFSGVAKYPARVKCALLPWMAFKDALARAQAALEQA